MNHRSSAFHGLAAFRGTTKPIGLLKAVRGCVGVELCVADRPIGPIGVCLSGHITAAFWGDCWSSIEENGRRDSQQRPCLENPTEREYYALCQEYREDQGQCGNNHAYCEAWMIPDGIDYVWVKPWANRLTRRVAEKLAKFLGTYVLTVEGTDRIDVKHGATPEIDPAPFPYDEYEVA